jgi:F-type H+-transporting ATPase subunit delta
MQSRRKVARRYARALIDSIPHDKWSLLEKALDCINEALSYPEVHRTLLNPKFRLSQRQDALKAISERALCASREVSDPVFRAIDLLLENGRLQDFPLLAEEVSDLLSTLRDETHVQVITSIELSSADQTPIVSSLQRTFGSGLQIRWKVDPNLAGGMQVRNRNKLFDGSVTGALEDLSTLLRRSSGSL